MEAFSLIKARALEEISFGDARERRGLQQNMQGRGLRKRRNIKVSRVERCTKPALLFLVYLNQES